MYKAYLYHLSLCISSFLERSCSMYHTEYQMCVESASVPVVLYYNIPCWLDFWDKQPNWTNLLNFISCPGECVRYTDIGQWSVDSAVILEVSATWQPKLQFWVEVLFLQFSFFRLRYFQYGCERNTPMFCFKVGTLIQYVIGYNLHTNYHTLQIQYNTWNEYASRYLTSHCHWLGEWPLRKVN